MVKVYKNQKEDKEYLWFETFAIAGGVFVSFCLIIMILFVFGVSFIACSTSQELTYRPVDSKELWNIRIEKGSISGQFEIYINDELILEETPSIFSDAIDEKTLYKNYEVRLIVIKTSSFFGIGEGQNVSLFIDNELIIKMDF